MKFFYLLFFLVIPVSLLGQISSQDSILISYNQKGDVHYLTSKQYFSRSQPDEAFAELLKAEEFYRKAGNNTGEATVNEKYADFYAVSKMTDDALQYYNKALLLLDTSKADAEEAGEIAYKMADIYLRKKKTDESLKYFAYSISRFESADQKSGQARSYVQIAGIRRGQKKFSDAENIILKQALPRYGSEDGPGRISCFDILARMYQDQKRYSEAKWFYLQGNTLARSLGDTTEIIVSLTKLAQVKLALNDHKLALQDLKEAQILAEKTKSVRLLSDVKLTMSAVYSKMGLKKKLKT